MQFKHAPAAVSAVFDDPNLVSAAGLVPMLRLARSAGLDELARERLSVPTDKGANAGAKVMALVAGMLAGADSIDDMNLLRHGAMSTLFDRIYAPSTLGTFLRGNSFGGPAQFAKLARQATVAMTAHTPVLGAPTDTLFIDVDDKVTEVYGPKKHGAAFGYRGIRGLNTMIAVASTDATRPIIIGQRLRKGNATSGTGTPSLLTDALSTVAATPHTGPVVVRLDSGFYGAHMAHAVLRTGADLSVTVRQFPWLRQRIATIDENAWIPYDYSGATRTDDGTLITDAATTELDYTAFANHPHPLRVPGRLIITRRVERHENLDPHLLPEYRYHAFFTTQSAQVIDTVAAVHQHHGHAIVEQIHSELHDGPLAHFPSGDFIANSIWVHLAAISNNLLRAAASLTDTLTHATIATIRRTLIHLPARLARSGRRITLHMPRNWHYQHAWTQLLNHSPPPH